MDISIGTRNAGTSFYLRRMQELLTLYYRNCCAIIHYVVRFEEHRLGIGPPLISPSASIGEAIRTRVYLTSKSLRRAISKSNIELDFKDPDWQWFPLDLEEQAFHLKVKSRQRYFRSWLIVLRERKKMAVQRVLTCAVKCDDFQRVSWSTES